MSVDILATVCNTIHAYITTLCVKRYLRPRMMLYFTPRIQKIYRRYMSPYSKIGYTLLHTSD